VDRAVETVEGGVSIGPDPGIAADRPMILEEISTL